MPTGKEQGSVRLNLRVSPEVKERLEVVKDVSHADTFAEVVRRALTLYEAMIMETRKGKTLVLRDEDGAEREVMLIF